MRNRRPRRREIRISLSEIEFRLLAAAAAARGITVGEYGQFILRASIDIDRTLAHDEPKPAPH